MACRHAAIIGGKPEDLAASTEAVENLEEGVQEVHEELRKATITQITFTTLAVLAICYFAKLVLVTIFTSILIAYILEPLVRLFKRIRVPRGVGSAIALRLELFLFPAGDRFRAPASTNAGKDGLFLLLFPLA